jgi:segregation and condensation protein A
MEALAVRDLELDLDAFEGPFDLLLTLVLKEELQLSDIEVAEIVSTFIERWMQTVPDGGPLEVDAEQIEVAGQFLVLVAALLELKVRELLASEQEVDLDDLDPEEAAAELAERLAAYRRARAGAAWLEARLEAESDRFFRLGPAPLAPRPTAPLAPQDPGQLVAALRALATEPPVPSLTHLALRLPPLSLFLERFRAALTRRRRFVFDDEIDGLSRIEQAVAFLALLELRRAQEALLIQAGPFEPITVAVPGPAPLEP